MRKATTSRNADGVLITIQQGCEKYNMCRNTVIRLAEEANAIYRFGKRMVRIDAERLNQYIKAEYGGDR